MVWEIARFLGVFGTNTASDISKLRKHHSAARDILVNFEISLVVFVPNTPRNRAISYTTIINFLLKMMNHSSGIKNILMRVLFMSSVS